MSDQGSRLVLKREDGASAANVEIPPVLTPAAIGERHREPSNVPARRQRRKYGEWRQQFDAAGQLRLEAVIRQTRWMMLLCFTHEKWGDILTDVYGDDLDPPSPERQFAHKKIFERVSAFKGTSINKMIKHVADLKKLDAEAGGSMASSRDARVLYTYFMSSFSQANFLRVFSFVASVLDVEGSSPLGKYYLQNIYANLAVRCKLHHDALEAKVNKAQSRKALLAFYDTMALRTEFKEVDMSCFKEQEKRGIRKKKYTTQRPKKSPDDDSQYIISGPPPPKTSSSSINGTQSGTSVCVPR